MLNTQKKIKWILLFLLASNQILIAQNHKNTACGDSLTALMSTEEKISFISGYRNFNIKGLERLGIPQIKMADGPMGIKGHGKATAFPASIAMAATWNTELITRIGSAIGKEAKSKGIGILLAPGTNMYRIPQCGRNFEYYGEDPCLASQTTVAFINGVQNENVMATVKHFIANNQDYDRHRLSSNIDERTLHEIYFPPFKAAVEEAKVGAVMTSYNLLNGIHTSESKYLIQDVLKRDWNFKGIVMSDWISVYSIQAFYAGLDLEMPRPQFMNAENINELLNRDPEAIQLLDNKVSRIIETCRNHGLYESQSEPQAINWSRHAQLARQTATESIVLLKNENNLLPIHQKTPQKILILGPNAQYTPYSGGGAAMIEAYKLTGFYDGIKTGAPKHIQTDYLPVEGIHYLHSNVSKDKFREQLSVAEEYDVVIVCLGFNSTTEGEAFDRPFHLPEEQDFLIRSLLEIQKNLIVVINSGGGIFMPWIDEIPVVLMSWYGGQECGPALADIVFGKSNPSAKLPVSIERQWTDNAASPYYDSTHAVAGAKPVYTIYGKAHEIKNMEYGEGIFTGYRHFDRNDKSPLFAFGYGLSYSKFELSDLKLDSSQISEKKNIKLSLDIKNTGDMDGAEVIQIYISDMESSLPRPIKELKAFKKVFLKKGEKRKIEFEITYKMLEFYHPEMQKWFSEEGAFEILIGNSSDQISLKTQIHLTK